MDKEKYTWRQARDELGLMAAAGLCFGVPFGGGCYIGWAAFRGLVRLLGE